MGLQQLFIGQLQGWCAHFARHHPPGIGEEVLIMGRGGAAIAQYQGRLATPPGAAAALRVVGWCWRHIAHVHRVECRNVDTQLHGGRAEHQPQIRFPELPFPLLALHRVHLGGVFTGEQGLQKGLAAAGNQRGQVGIKIAEIAIHRPTAALLLQLITQQRCVAVLRRGLRIHQAPTQAAAVQPPALQHLTRLTAQLHLHRLHQAPGLEHVHQMAGDFQIEVLLPLVAAVQLLNRQPAFSDLEPAAKFTP